MTRSTRVTLAAMLPTAALVALAAGGCGGSEDTTTMPTPKAQQGSTVAVASTDLGDVLVDANGRTVYLFQKDSGTTSACDGGCADDWPPVTVASSPTAGSGVTASLIGTTKRSDGTMQATYNGHPLYLFSGDSKAGDTKGEGLSDWGGLWFALGATGESVSGSGAR